MTEGDVPGATWIAGASAVASMVSAVVAVVAARTTMRSIRLQERALSMEAGKLRLQVEAQENADIVIEYVKSGRRFPNIVVSNLGPADAFDISLAIDNVPFADSDDILIQKGAPATIAKLPVGSSYEFEFYLHAMTPQGARTISASWRLASGRGGACEALIQP